MLVEVKTPTMSRACGTAPLLANPRQPSGATNAARWRTRSLLRDLCRKPYTGQLFTSGQKRVLDGDVRCRRVSGLSSFAIEIPAAHFRARVLADGQPHLGRDGLLQVAGLFHAGQIALERRSSARHGAQRLLGPIAVAPVQDDFVTERDKAPGGCLSESISRAGDKNAGHASVLAAR